MEYWGGIIGDVLLGCGRSVMERALIVQSVGIVNRNSFWDLSVLLVLICSVCFNLYCGGFILFCDVCVCVCMCGFCNVCVCVGVLVICILYSD